MAEILSYSRPGPGAVGTEHLTFQADFDGHGSCLCRWGHLMVNGNRVSPGDLIRVLIDPACPVHRSHVVLMADLKRQAPGIELVEPFVGRYCECTDGRHRS